MKRKIILLIIVLLLFIPIQSTLGIKTKTIPKQTFKSGIEEDIIEMLEKIDESLLYDYVEDFESFGFKKVGSENADKCAHYIYDEFVKYGLDAHMDPWEFVRHKDKNVVAIKEGSDTTSDAVFVISAHYDTIGGSPGANDDGSGIATMLAIANLTQQYDFAHTIRFIAVSGEEVGTFGSFYDAKEAYKRDENIIALLDVDQVGFANSTEDGKILQVFSRESSNWILDFSQNISYKYNLDLELLHTGAYPADHESYNDYGFHAICFIESRPDLSRFWCHSPEDTIEKVNFTYLVKVAKLSLATICELADKPIDLQIRIIDPKEGQFYFHILPVFKLPEFNLYQTRLRALTIIWGIKKMEVEVTSSEEINMVFFKVDGDIRSYSLEPPYEFWIGKGAFGFYPLWGHHTITACAVTKTGKFVNDEMDVFICRIIP